MYPATPESIISIAGESDVKSDSSSTIRNISNPKLSFKDFLMRFITVSSIRTVTHARIPSKAYCM